MENNEWLVNLVEEQQKILADLVARLFEQSREGVNLTKNEVEDLIERHELYHSNIYQLNELKTKLQFIQVKYDRRINEILTEIQNKKERSKEILQNALDQLEETLNNNRIKQYLSELMVQMDTMFSDVPDKVLLVSIFGSIGLSSVIISMIALLGGGPAVGIATAGVAVVATVAASEVTFRVKLSNLKEKLIEIIIRLGQKKNEQLRRIDSYFYGFVQRFRYTDNDNSTTDIIWFDKNAQGHENQAFAHTLSNEFPLKKYRVIQFDNETSVIEFVRTNIESNIILITSGSAGEPIISEVGYFWSMKGIIIYCMRTDYHRTWASKYKKVLLVTKSGNNVIQKIKQIESGDIYFLINGFSLEDIGLQNFQYFSSKNENDFFIQNFQCINPDKSYHRNVMERLYAAIISKNLYPTRIPVQFQLNNLYELANQFLAALAQSKPENAIINLYTKQAPYYYKVVNDILNRLDRELIILIGDYIKALRYALIVYEDPIDATPKTSDVKLYRGLCLAYGDSLKEFEQKFRVNDVIIFPSFLSTSLSKKKAIVFTKTEVQDFNKTKAQLFTKTEASFFTKLKNIFRKKREGVLLQISVDWTLLNAPKNIANVSEFVDEEEVLLNCFSVLRVKTITTISDHLLSYECKLVNSLNDH